MDIQVLLNREAELFNKGLGDSSERAEILTMIRLKRVDQPRCFGLDDCSSAALICCPWRIDCGK